MDERPCVPRYAQVAKAAPPPQAPEPRKLLRLELKKKQPARKASPTLTPSSSSSLLNKEKESSNSFSLSAPSYIPEGSPLSQSLQELRERTLAFSGSKSLEASSTPIYGELFHPTLLPSKTSVPGRPAQEWSVYRTLFASDMSASWWSACQSSSSSHPPNVPSDNIEMLGRRGDGFRPPIRPDRHYSSEAPRVPFISHVAPSSAFPRTQLLTMETPPSFPSLSDLSHTTSSRRQPELTHGLAPAEMYYSRPLRGRRRHGDAPSFTTAQAPDTPSPLSSCLKYPVAAGDASSFMTAQSLEPPSRPPSRLRPYGDGPSFTTAQATGPLSRPSSRLRHAVAAGDIPSFTTVQSLDQPSRPPSRLRYPVAAGDFVPAASSAPQSGLSMVKEEGSANKSAAVASRGDSDSLRARVAVPDIRNVRANVGQDKGNKKKDKVTMVEKATMVEKILMVEKATMTDSPADYNFAVTKSPAPVSTTPRIRPPPGIPYPFERQKQELERSNTVAWFYPPEIRSSIDIWDHDHGTEERRLTDWPGFDERKDAGDHRAQRRKPRLLPIPQYHSLDARSVFIATDTKDMGTVEPGSAAAAAVAPFMFIPLLYRKYAVDLVGPVNRFPIPCDNDGIIAVMQVAELDYDNGDIKEEDATSVTAVINGA